MNDRQDLLKQIGGLRDLIRELLESQQREDELKKALLRRHESLVYENERLAHDNESLRKENEKMKRVSTSRLFDLSSLMIGSWPQGEL